MKKRLLIALLAVATIVGSMAGIASAAEEFQRVEGIIDYEAIKTITADMTYRDLAKLILEKNTAVYTSSPEIELLSHNYYAEFLNPIFKTDNYNRTAVEFSESLVDLHAEDFKDNPYMHDMLINLDRTIDADTVIKFGYYVEFIDQNTQAHINILKTYINDTEVEWKEYPKDWAGALGSEYKVAAETDDEDVFFYFYIGKVGEILSPSKKVGANTSDSSNIALFSILAVLAFAGAGYVYMRREN